MTRKISQPICRLEHCPCRHRNTICLWVELLSVKKYTVGQLLLKSGCRYAAINALPPFLFIKALRHNCYRAYTVIANHRRLLQSASKRSNLNLILGYCSSDFWDIVPDYEWICIGDYWQQIYSLQHGGNSLLFWRSIYDRNHSYPRTT